MMSTIARAAVLAALALATPACFLFSSAPLTEIEQGRTMTTGKAPYDTFFQEVRAMHEEASKAESQAQGVRAGLSRALGIAESASSAAALDAARARAAKLKDGGVLLHLQITPEVKLVSATGKKGKLADEDKGVLTAVEESAKGSLTVSKQLMDLAGRAAGLDKKRASLEQELEAAFADASGAQRRDVQRELEAAGRLLSEARDAGDHHAALTSKFVLDLAMAVETGAAPGATRDEKKRPGGRPAGGASAARPAGGRPAGTPPAQPPKPKPAGGGDDFEP